MSRARVRLAASLTLAAGLALGASPAATASSDPGWTPTQVTPKPPVQALTCQWAVTGVRHRTVTIHAVNAEGRTGVISVSRPYSAAAVTIRGGVASHRFPLRLTNTDVVAVTVDGIKCGVA